MLRSIAAELDGQAVDEHLAEAKRVTTLLESEGFRVSVDMRIGTQAAARLLDRAPKSLRNWRCAGTGPAWHADGGIVLYRIVDVLAWRAGVSRSVPIHDADCMR